MGVPGAFWVENSVRHRAPRYGFVLDAVVPTETPQPHEFSLTVEEDRQVRLARSCGYAVVLASVTAFDLH